MIAKGMAEQECPVVPTAWYAAFKTCLDFIPFQIPFQENKQNKKKRNIPQL